MRNNSRNITAPEHNGWLSEFVMKMLKKASMASRYPLPPSFTPAWLVHSGLSTPARPIKATEVTWTHSFVLLSFIDDVNSVRLVECLTEAAAEAGLGKDYQSAKGCHLAVPMVSNTQH